MNFHLLQHRKLSEVLSIPDGLQDLMADIAREVLRYQPSNIECFIADYLESLLLTRELMYVTDQTVNDILNNSIQVKLLMTIANISLADALAVVKVAEEEFRKKNVEQLTELQVIHAIVGRCNLTVEQAKKISSVIGDSWHHFYTQNSIKYPRVNPGVFNASAAKNTLLYHQRLHNCQNKSLTETQQPQQTINGNENWITENFQRRENAAIFIQSWYRGKKRQLSEKHKAALAIQTAFRGFREQKQLEKEQHKSAIVIQKSFRNYKDRQDHTGK